MLVVAVVAGFVLVVDALEPEPAATAVEQPRLVLEPARPARVSPRAPAAGDGAPTPAPTIEPESAAARAGAGGPLVEATFRGPEGWLTLTVLAAGARPDPNRAPVVTGPASVPVTGQRVVAVPGVSVDDPDEQGDDLGLWLSVPEGRIFVADGSGARFLWPQGDAALVLVGPAVELNAALAGLRVTAPSRSTTLTLLVRDFGHGDLDRERTATWQVALDQR